MLRGMLMAMVLLAASLCYAEPPKWLGEKTLGFTVAGRDVLASGYGPSGSNAYDATMGFLDAPKGAEVFVDRVFAHGQADGKLRPRSFITQANGKPMKTPADWQNLIDASKPGDKVKFTFKQTLDKGTWGKAETLTLAVSTKRDEARKAVTITTDEVSGLKSAQFKRKIAADERPLIMSFSVGADGKATRPMLNVTHLGKDWIFVDSVSVRGGDTLKTITLEDAAQSRKAITGAVVEIYLVPMSGVVREAAELLTNKEKTIVRLSGTNPHVDHTITPEQKEAMRSMMAAFVAYDGEWPE